MAHNTDFSLFGRFFREEWAVYAVSYGGLLLDLLIVPLLLWRRTRIVAFCVAVGFHLINARAFVIGIFPWLAICATTLFFSPDWPRRIVRLVQRVSGPTMIRGARTPSPSRQSVVLTLTAVYFLTQLLVPIRYFLWPGGLEWTSIDHRFSWRMMLVNRKARSYFYVTDPNNGRMHQVRPEQFLTRRQTAMLAYQPDLPLQFAHYLASVIPRTGPNPLKVEARILVSINGRKPQLLLDPNVDLANEKRSFGRPRWLLPIREPLPPHRNDFSENDLAAQFDER